MDQPTLIDYAHLIITIFDQFVQTNPVVLRYQNLCTYKYREMIIFFMLMQFRRTYEFKAQHRWVKAHPEIRTLLKFKTIPDRTTLSRQYKKLGEVLIGGFCPLPQKGSIQIFTHLPPLVNRRWDQ